MDSQTATARTVPESMRLAGLAVGSLCVVLAAYHAGTSGEPWPLALATLGLGGFLAATMD
ncbi:hypothetical protein [Halovenus salina]|uniref:Uncharacterized protein n=1 Tax=Halovenus salina TaxID=1510225 RepID=A0ABD5W3P7_9EURY|nr:hypothetical protein [Halovenus salina]